MLIRKMYVWTDVAFYPLNKGLRNKPGLDSE